jgi:hypothetical protein
MPIITTIRGNLRPIGKKRGLGLGTTGGTVTIANGYRIHKFTTIGTSTFTPDTSGLIEVIIVGGGASGGVDCGGGGGAGGLIDTTIEVTAQNYSIVVGAGGQSRPGSADDGPGYNGFNSSAFNLIALGGGAGTGWTNGGTPIGGSNPGTMNGGSGGGQSTSGPLTGSVNSQGRGIAAQPGSASGGYGFNGGFATPGYAGGGGGAGGAGGNGTNGKAGDGGEGYFLNGRFGPGVGVNDYLAGGGAGGYDHVQGLRSSAVFTRNGTTKQLTETGENNCPDNTGAGGNGANHDNENSGAGGSGIVLIRYPI